MTVSLNADGTEIATATLDSGNEWKYTWNDLPMYQPGATDQEKTRIVYYGEALLNGRGVPENAEAAFKYFLRAADAGYPPAMENLSTCYQYGKGVKADGRRSMEWKIRSRAARGDRNAQAWLQQNAK